MLEAGTQPFTRPAGVFNRHTGAVFPAAIHLDPGYKLAGMTNPRYAGMTIARHNTTIPRRRHIHS